MGILRTQMEHDLIVRGRAERTRESYLHTVAALTRYYRRAPDQLTDREVQQYLRYLIEERQLAWSSCRVAVAGLRFFYEITLGRTRGEFTVPLPKGAQKLPEILSNLHSGPPSEGSASVQPGLSAIRRPAAVHVRPAGQRIKPSSLGGSTSTRSHP